LRGHRLRLPVFNTNIEIVDKNNFQGLPSPAQPRWWQVSSGMMLDNAVHRA